MSAPTDFATLQRAIQDRVLRGVLDTSDIVRFDDEADAAVRMDIYASAYRLRLIEALAANFPLLQAHLGDDAFAAIARAYIDAHPSSFVSIRTFGIHLAHWLERHRPADPWLAEFARLEWALGCAFDAKDAAPVAVERLAVLSPDDWATLVFRFAPSVQRLMLHTNAAELYAAAANGEPASIGRPLLEPAAWLVWRRALQAQYRSLAVSEAAALDTLLAGDTFGDACERLAEVLEHEVVPTTAVAFLKRWLLDELIVEVDVHRH